jgi:hypothetical protein
VRFHDRDFIHSHGPVVVEIAFAPRVRSVSGWPLAAQPPT